MFMFYTGMNSVKLAKPIIKHYTPNDSRKVCSLKVYENKAGELTLNIKKDTESGENHFITELKNKFNKILGYEIFKIPQNNDYVIGKYINVEEEYRQKKYFFGEILRLTSIIEMLENKIKQFDIVSKNTAVYFHSKYKFAPSIKSSEDMEKILNSIINDKNVGYEEIAQKAKLIQQKIKSCNNEKTRKEYFNNANSVVKEYIEKVLKDKSMKKHPFTFNMEMTLTRENILKNKEFFNQLFKKHGIDYNI